ncbi:hypothetical protein EK21DRAFT_108817 [Setomelanomma holmii]|uniref:Uncharacterized protein n=1 Tax=Setomelanomma holmii TaxID=210430 RepID=A0A9P4HGP9_9PLEO|nr:hypothetical protein EK21DRAFT_108817 [Setomelanomma holmii]
MSGDTNLIARRPAEKVGGGQRRRLARKPPAIPRSTTTPSFSTALAGASECSEGSAISAIVGEGAYRRHAEEGASTLEASQSMMNFYPPTGIPADYRPSASGGLCVAGNESPTPSAGSEPSNKADGKKKHGRKIKDFVLGSNKQLPRPPQPTTPLPPATPTKAAKLLGVTPDVDLPGNPRPVQHDGPADGFNDLRPWIKQGWPQQHSPPNLPRSASSSTFASSSRESKFREEDVDVDLTTPKDSNGFWNSSKKATRKMSGYFSLNRPVLHQPEPASDSARLEFESSPPHSRGLYTDNVYSIGQGLDDSHYVVPPRPSRAPAMPLAPVVPPHPNRAAPSRPPRRRKARGPRPPNVPTTITEASHDNLIGAYRDGEDNSELDVIAEYARDIPPRNASLQYRDDSQYGPYELEEDELSPADEDAEQVSATQEEKGGLVQYDEAKWQRPGPVYLRSPLQNVEDRLLDAAEQKFKHTHIRENSSPEEEDFSVHGSTISLSKAKQPANNPVTDNSSDDYRLAATEDDSARRLAALDKIVQGLKANHDKMKEDFEAIQKKQTEEEIEKEVEVESDDDSDLPSLRSSIDLSEEPTVHTAGTMTITEVTPGMVELVDIPPRRNKK